MIRKNPRISSESTGFHLHPCCMYARRGRKVGLYRDETRTPLHQVAPPTKETDAAVQTLLSTPAVQSFVADIDVEESGSASTSTDLMEESAEEESDDIPLSDLIAEKLPSIISETIPQFLTEVVSENLPQVLEDLMEKPSSHLCEGIRTICLSWLALHADVIIKKFLLDQEKKNARSSLGVSKK